LPANAGDSIGLRFTLGDSQPFPILKVTTSNWKILSWNIQTAWSAGKKRTRRPIPALELQKTPPQYGVLAHPGIAVLVKRSLQNDLPLAKFPGRFRN
jgi:hypothetical protein